MSKAQNNLYARLSQYADSDAYPFHMPGHKRNSAFLPYTLPYELDITEISGFDNLHDSHGILKVCTEKAQKAFSSKNSYMLVGGSTCGILSAVSSVVSFGDEIIAARNCHKSVYNACAINNLTMHFIYPPQDKESGICSSVDPESVRKILLEYPESKAIVITSPTYEGVISDIRSIAEIAHSHGIPLIVDNAHGAHQHFCRLSREGEPIECGADIVISSLHKTLPSLTQTAIAHIGGSLIDKSVFENKLSVFETSSPSYILMASMDICFDFLLDCEQEFERYCSRLASFGEKMSKLKNLRVLCHGTDNAAHGFFAFDKGKIVILTGHTDINGIQLMERLRSDYGIELEMAYPTYAVAMTSVCDSDEGFARLCKALLDIDSKLSYRETKLSLPDIPKPEMAHSSTDTNIISRSYIYAYPPGIPIVIPGEIIDTNVQSYITALKKAGVEVLS